MALVTATNDFITRPIAAAFGIGRLDRLRTRARCARPHHRPHPWHAGLPRARSGASRSGWPSRAGQALERASTSQVYSDSTNDLPLLEQASRPGGHQSRPGAQAVAQQRDWRILKLFT
ncbi:MAG: haloacid dehalogenase-like hydrolase [Betaproteobacteria bacterium]|nr:haloacid dehalogenase-like hydrolase [Betaproteobacteria bacterium]